MKEIHYRYWLGILVAILIGSLTVNWSGMKDLVNLLSFGLSLTSLVLAVIAIFQTLFSNAAVTSVQQSITQAAAQLEAGAKEIEQARTHLIEQIGQIPAALGEMSNRFETFEEKLINSTKQEFEKSVGIPPTPSVAGELPHATFGLRVAYYLCVLAYEHKKIVQSH